MPTLSPKTLLQRLVPLFSLFLLALLSASPVLADEPLLGSWKDCAGHVVTFTAEGAELIGRYTDPGPGSPFTVNEIVVRAKPLGGGRYDAPILWRWTDGRSEWRQNTITVTGDQYSQTGADSCTQTMTRVGGDGGRREVFDHPQMNGAMVDWCVTWATSCGQGGADNFCRIKGYERAESFQTDKPGRTYVIGDNKFCEGDFCDGFSQVVCVGTAPAGGTGRPAERP